MQLPPFLIERYFAPREFRAPYMLSASDCESHSIAEILALEPGATEAFLELRLGYTESAGAPTLRDEIVKLYATIEPDDVLVHTGAEEAILTFMLAALAPGDHVIVHYPSFQSLHEIARWKGCEVTLWHTRAAQGWELDLDLLRDSIRPATRAIVINCPHNPSGYLPDPTIFAGVVEIARENNLLLFSDEVYRGLEYDGRHRLPAACDLYENAVSLGVMSKVYGLGGLRIGWTATRNRRLRDAIWQVKDYTTICNSAASEFLARVALRSAHRIAERNVRIIRSNLALLSDFFAAHSDRFDWVPPKAGSVCFPTLLGNGTVDQFCAELLDREGVLLLPGTLFDPASHEVRFGIGRLSMPEALARLGGYLQHHPR